MNDGGDNENLQADQHAIDRTASPTASILADLNAVVVDEDEFAPINNVITII